MYKRQAYDHVDVITPVVQADGGKVNIQCGDYVYQDSVYGVYPEALEKLGYCLLYTSSPVKEIADEYGLSESKVTVTLFRTRGKLKSVLEKEGITL